MRVIFKYYCGDNNKIKYIQYASLSRYNKQCHCNVSSRFLFGHFSLMVNKQLNPSQFIFLPPRVLNSIGSIGSTCSSQDTYQVSLLTLLSQANT